MVERARFRPRLPPGRVSWRRPRDRFGRPCHDRRAARREVPDSGARAHRDRGDSVNASDLEVFQTGLSFIPEEMGVALRRTAYSPNIKERMDASCALFDADGRIVSQAEHIPVHLGSMPVAVEAAMRDFPGTLRERDQIILNDPYRGGTHLPDVTLIRPVFLRQAVIGFAVNRAHHAESGGFERPSANCLEGPGPRRISSNRRRSRNRSESGFMRKSRSGVLESPWISRARIARSPEI